MRIQILRSKASKKLAKVQYNFNFNEILKIITNFIIPIEDDNSDKFNPINCHVIGNRPQSELNSNQNVPNLSTSPIKNLIDMWLLNAEKSS